MSGIATIERTATAPAAVAADAIRSTSGLPIRRACNGRKGFLRC